MKNVLFITTEPNGGNYHPEFKKQFTDQGINVDVVSCDTPEKIYKKITGLSGVGYKFVADIEKYDFIVIFDSLPDVSSHMVFTLTNSITNILCMNEKQSFVFRCKEENINLYFLALERKRMLSNLLRIIA